MNYGKDLLEFTKFSCNSVAMPLLIQISLCLISCTLSGYAASIIVLRFTLLNNELITTSFTLIFLVRNDKISLTVSQFFFKYLLTVLSLITPFSDNLFWIKIILYKY